MLSRFSLDQIAQGIWFLVGEASPAQPSHHRLDRAIALDQRITCISSIATFFREFVASAAPAAADTETNDFHSACYMWRDIFPTWGSGDVEPEIAEACLKTMAEVLASPTELCQLSALHGLNHWGRPGRHGADVERTIDAFLETSDGPTPRIREYAALARRGLAL